MIVVLYYWNVLFPLVSGAKHVRMPRDKMATIYNAGFFEIGLCTSVNVIAIVIFNV